MKILHIIDSGGLYGAEIVLLNLVAEQVKLGLDPAIVSIGEKGICEKPIETEALKRGFKVRKFRMLPGPNLIGAVHVLRFAHSEGFDLMHSHGYKGNILFGFMPRRIRRLPLVSTLHGYTSTNGISKMKVYEWLDAKSLKFIDAVVLVNKGMFESPRLKKNRGVHFHVVNNGIAIFDEQVTQVTQASDQTLDKTIVAFCQQGFTIGAIGRLSEEKGYTYLIEALDQLVKVGIDSRLVIIGEGDYRGVLENSVRMLGLGDRVLLPGYREDAKRYLPLFSVFALSSLTEGLPITLLEAMKAGVPIVATRVGGIPDVLADGETGLLVQPKNPFALGEAIGKIRKDSNLANKFLASARRTVEERYCSRRMASEYLELYKCVLSAAERA